MLFRVSLLFMRKYYLLREHKYISFIKIFALLDWVNKIGLSWRHCPFTGRYILLKTSGRILNLLSADSGYTFWSQLCSSPLYPHNTLYTRNDGYHTYISDSHASQISWGNSSLSGILQFLIPSIWAVSLPTCGNDPGSILLLWSLFLFCGIALPVSDLRLPWCLCISPVCGTLVQIRYATCIPILYGLNYLLCPSWAPPVLYFCGLQTYFYTNTGVSFI